MRGKANGNKFIDGKYRITPAYAGKSVLGDPRCHSSRDHPRLCGEKLISLHKSSSERGSPPPMRGKGIFFGIYAVIIGITPAYAGKRESCMHPVIVTQDHPRLCGEKTDLNILTLSKLGSPPPMRGKAPAGCCPACTGRITPAYAGKRRTGGAVQRDRWDHPRLCGEKWGMSESIAPGAGSPPPMRGKGKP